MRLGIRIGVMVASAALLASGAGGSARAASDAVPAGESVTAVPDSASRDPQNSSKDGGVYRSGTAQPAHRKPSKHAAGPFAGSFDSSTGPTKPDGPDLGSK
jgi:hypothetical protein